MILIKFFIGIFFLIFSSQIIMKAYFPNDNYSTILIRSFIALFSFIWIVFLLSYYIGINDYFLQVIVFFIVIYSLYKVFKQDIFLLYIIKNFVFALILLFPLWHYFGDIFTEWDAVVSWNRWAIAIYHNIYKPEGTAYPVLLSSLIGFIYKVQGSGQIWWTAKISLFIIPLFITMILINLFRETKNSFFLFVFFLSYTYLTSAYVISGYVDFPVALIGLLVLVVLYIPKATNNTKEIDLYLILAFFISGISAVAKQAGVAFCIFSIVYAFLNYKNIKNIKMVLIYWLLSMGYVATFFLVFYSNNKSALSNLEYLQNLSNVKYTIDFLLNKVNLFLSLPATDSFFIPYYAIFASLGILFYIFMNEKDELKYSLLLNLFFILGFFLWYQNFSYDARNGMWSKVFLIVSASVVLKIIIEKQVILKYLLLLFILFGLYFLFTNGNKIAFSQQEKYQITIGKADIAEKVHSLVANKEPCVKVITNRLPMYYNYYLKDYTKQIVSNAWYVDGFMPYFKHDCKDGRYFVFGEWTKTNPGTGWEIIDRLEKEGKIFIQEPRDMLIYYIPPIAGTFMYDISTRLKTYPSITKGLIVKKLTTNSKGTAGFYVANFSYEASWNPSEEDFTVGSWALLDTNSSMSSLPNTK